MTNSVPDKISDYFEGVAAKYLTAVDADPGRSNQHEIGGLPKAGFRQWLGTPGKHEEYRFPVKQVYIRDEDEIPLTCESEVTWYDARRNVLHRGPEYRLYYYDSEVTAQLSPGDFFLVAKLRDNSLFMVFTPAGSTVEYQLRAIFGLIEIDQTLRAGNVNAIELQLPLRLALESLGLQIAAHERSDSDWLDQLIAKFGGKVFPSTAEFSNFARNSATDAPSPVDFPDQALMAWMEHEEKLFRIYERHIVKDKLQKGFGNNGADVDDFIAFSLSVQNRRKSRVGHAFEGHIHHLLTIHGILFEQGRGKERFTENNAKPDFLFPSFESYKNPAFSAEKLVMLGAKTTCKDRWRQVLSEAERIRIKHLITLEPAISETQTKEMAAHNLKLVIPENIQATYSLSQRASLITLKQFIRHVKSLQEQSK